MIKDDCIFCKLANGIFPTSTIYEDDNYRAILDIAPSAKGHVLILPKNHMADLFEIDTTVQTSILEVARKIGLAQKKVLKCDGVNLLQNSGEAAGQTVFHLHLHMIPRYHDDNLVIPWKKLSYKDNEADDLTARLQAAVN